MQLVSVVIPVYNGEKYLAEAIESALGQDYPQVEVVVVDDGSTDSSGQIASGYGDSISFLSQERGGNGAARNFGVSKSQGELLSFLDADDRWHPTKLERECAALATRPDHHDLFQCSDSILLCSDITGHEHGNNKQACCLGHPGC